MEAARAALLGMLSNEEAAAAVALAVPQAVTEEWMAKHMELVTAFKLSRGQDGATSVALMRRPRAMCHPNVVRTVDVPLAPACVDLACRRRRDQRVHARPGRRAPLRSVRASSMKQYDI